MSFTAIRAAFHHIKTSKMSIKARLVLLCLADHHNQETGRCDPSINRVVEATGLSERSVRAALRELEFMKIITTTFRKKTTGSGVKNMTNRYRIKVARRQEYNRRGGAQFAGGMGHGLPPNQEHTASVASVSGEAPKEPYRESEISEPSAYDDLVNLLEDFGEEQ